MDPLPILTQTIRISPALGAGGHARYLADTVARGTSTGGHHPGDIISLQALMLRLTVLATIELPCAVQFDDAGRQRDTFGTIRKCGRSGGCFQLSGENFDLLFREAAIAAVRLAHEGPSGSGHACIDIISTTGKLLARLKSPPEQTGAAVWQDIMDTFHCA